jgi:hypothetical protein
LRILLFLVLVLCGVGVGVLALAEPQLSDVSAPQNPLLPPNHVPSPTTPQDAFPKDKGRAFDAVVQTKVTAKDVIKVTGLL